MSAPVLTDPSPAADDLTPGMVVQVEVGPVAHGGHCVARYDGRVLFVRHALPGEVTLVRITEARAGSFGRADAVRILQADPERVDAPCTHFHPGGCGGCDFQHASPDLQRRLKAEVLAEQLHRLAGIDRPVTVEALPGDGFGWRTRVRWALDPDGRMGPRSYRSHRVQAVNLSAPCLIAAPGLNELAATLNGPPGGRPSAPTGPARRPVRRAPAGRHRRPELPEVTLVRTQDGERLAVWAGQPAAEIAEHVADRDFVVSADGFWQVHPAAAQTLVDAVDAALDGVDLVGGTGWDLYGGVGVFAELLARAVGGTGSVVSVEGDARAVALAARNLARHPQARAVHGSVEDTLAGLGDRVDAVVLDPPRSGAGRAVCTALAARQPAVIVYVACDPAALARDAAALADAGYALTDLRAFDAFPQTHHLECVARFAPA